MDCQENFTGLFAPQTVQPSTSKEGLSSSKFGLRTSHIVQLCSSEKILPSSKQVSTDIPSAGGCLSAYKDSFN